MIFIRAGNTSLCLALSSSFSSATMFKSCASKSLSFSRFQGIKTRVVEKRAWTCNLKSAPLSHTTDAFPHLRSYRVHTTRVQCAPRPWCSQRVQSRVFSSLNAVADNQSGSDAEEGRASASPLAVKTEWDVRGLKKEAARQVLRQFKRVTKADDRRRRLTESEESDELELLEAECAVEEARMRLEQLNKLEEMLQSVKKTGSPGWEPCRMLAVELEVNDSPPPKQPRGPKKVKQAPPTPRKPYWVYTSKDGVEVRVGRGAKDNDLLSCDPQLRSPADWWMHVSGYPGSHVVIRYEGDDLREAMPDTVMDAALLAAKNSKGPQKGKSKVSLTRCRQVSKPPGAKPGLVRLNGDVGTIRVDVNAESARLERLENNLSK